MRPDLSRRAGLRGSKKLLLAGVSLLALGGTVRFADAAGILSQGGAGIAPIPTSITTGLADQQQAQAVALQAQNQLSRISTALQAMQNMQTAAHSLALTAPSTVPDGLQTGGLVPDSGLAAPGVANPVTWSGARTPTQAVSAGHTDVTINQTAAQAILSWNSFNVGQNTTVDFNQQGNANWVALNRIAPSGVPSQILGSIKASGQVYLINPNGIIFGGGSQVNVGALIASSADLSDSQFLANGIYSPQTGASYMPSFSKAGGAIVVQPGALISTAAPASVTAQGGFVMLLGTTVQNSGSISTPVGQTVLAAGDSFVVRPGLGTSINTFSTTRGSEIGVALNTKGSSAKPGGSGLVINDGIVTADTGDITLAGEAVDQNGVLVSTTSVAVRGTIHLLSSASDPFSSVILGGNSSTLIMPELSSGATGLDSQRAAAIAASALANGQRIIQPQFDDISLLPDRQDESRIDIVTGGIAEFRNGSNTVAQGGQVAVSAAGRVQADSGATIDVSGSYGVPLAMSANDIAVNIQNFELRDNPQNRVTQALNSNTVFVDDRTLSLVPGSTAAYPSGRDYTAGGVLEVSGYLATTGHTIGEYTALGGSIDLATGAAGAIVTQAGSIFDVAGGSLQYQSGYLQQSYLQAGNGQIYNVNNAPAYLTYTGVYNGFAADHPRWNETQTYRSVLSDPSQVYQAGYTEGRAAGTLTLSSPTAVFAGTIEAGTVNGALQTNAAPAGTSDPYTLPQNVVAMPGGLSIGTLAGGSLLPSNSNVAFSGAPENAAGGAAMPIAAGLVGTSIFNAVAINNFGLGALQVITNGSLNISAPLTLAPGGQFGLFGSSVDIAGDLTAASGGITASEITAGSSPLVLQLPHPPHGVAATGNTVVAPGVIISTAGLWSNLALDPSITFAQAFFNGGAVTLQSANNLTLGQGSVVDASSGGVIAANGTGKGGAGGAISLSAAADQTKPKQTGVLRLDGTLQSAGFSKGGALTLSALSFLISNAPQSKPAPATVVLNAAFFTQGFSAYNLNSPGNIAVDPGTAVNVVEPVYQFNLASGALPTGSDPALGYDFVLNPVYIANSAFTSITQRPGASFSAVAVPNLGQGLTAPPGFSLGEGAAIQVDPGQNIHLEALGQLTIDGGLSAPGGNISILNDFLSFNAPQAGAGSLSIWVGPQSVIDASAQPFTAFNGIGGALSVVPAGGSVALGSTTSAAAIIVRAGAVIEASGAAAVDEIAPHTGFGAGLAGALPAGVPIAVQSNGGAISLASTEGIYNDGALLAAGGGVNAAGGRLAISIEANQVLNSAGFESVPRVFTITQNDPAAFLPDGLKPGQTNPALVAGTARISAAQISAGKFGSVALFSRDAFVFQDNVTLSAAQSISLLEGVITDSSRTGSVTLNAPYVLLSGQTPETNGTTGRPLAVIGGFSAQAATGSFIVNAALIDLTNRVRFGGVLPAPQTGGAVTDLAGFGAVDLNSTGALRFAPSTSAISGSYTDLVTAANLDLAANQIFAVNGASALVVAGYNPAGTPGNGGFNPKGVLNISRTGATAPVAPDTLGGTLNFEAATINQGGEILQPLGQLGFGNGTSFIGDGLTGGGDPNTSVNFLPGSVTSVSAAGLTLPYGGTTDGVTYSVNGLAVQSANSISFGLPGVANGVRPGSIGISALTTDIQTGAVLDLSGGGNLAGQGFISGEGGSTDVLYTPLLNVGASGVTQPGLGTNPVYAIVAGPQQAQAQAVSQTGESGSAPAIGAQIVIPVGVPGLTPGRYTLLPAAYALTPGGYRVEFDGTASLAAPAVAALPNGSYEVAGFSATANTNVQSSLAGNFTITPGATVRNYAQYDEQSYSQFLIATAARLGAIRPALPVDAGSLTLTLPAASATSLVNDGLTAFQAATGGQGGTLQVAGAAFAVAPNFDIFGAASTANLPAGTVSLSAAAIDAFHPFILELGVAGGGGLNAHANSVTLENGATLSAARVIITTSAQGDTMAANGIKLDSGAQIITLGQGTLFADSSNFGLYSNGGASVLDAGNGYLSYATVPPAQTAYGPVTVQDGAKIYSDGSIAISTSAAVNIGVNASYGAKYLDLDVPEINVGDPQALGAIAPAGLLLTPAVLQNLTQGNAAIGLPAVQIVVLTATDSLNFYGTAALDLTGQNVQLVINTPAIYGFGGPGDVASVSASTIVWNGISAIDPQTLGTVSSLPGGAVTNGPGSGQGALDFNAANIVLGYSSLDKAQRDVPLNRLTLGFSTVNLNATAEITANNQGTLAVYQGQANFGQPGTGGTLNLNTPLLTAADQAAIGFTAGGVINEGLGAPSAAQLAAGSAGGEIDLTGGAVNIDGVILLPSGKLDVLAANDISLGAASVLNLAGMASKIVDKTVDGFGGDVLLQSAAGNVGQAVGSVIDVAATGNNAGSVSVTATGAAAGKVALDGTLQGGSTGGFNAGSFDIRAQSAGDFASLNTALDAGQFFQARSFDIAQGDLTVGNGVQAHDVTISVDGGSLVVNGLIDASGGGGGNITLAAAANLTLASGAALDAAGTVLQVDSYGVPIPAANAPVVSLTTTSGELTLAPDATIDLASADKIARGDLQLNVPRLGGVTAGDANIAVAGAVAISGASSIAVNAFATYNGLADTAGTVTGNPDALITQAYLDQINTNGTLPFMQNAANNADLNNRLGVLRTTYGANFHFRPGVQIVSATPDGDLTVQGDLNLAGYRYGPGVVAGVYGSGEPGVLLIRAGGNLNVYGSITDGFAPPASDAGTEFAQGWVVFSQGEPYLQNQTLPTAATIASGSNFAAGGAPVNFAVPITGGTFQAGAAAPVALTVQGRQVTTVAFVATSAIASSTGAVLFAQGQVVPAGTVIPSHAMIAAGGSFPFDLTVGAVTWPANTPFTVTNFLTNGNGVVLAGNLPLLAGSFIPAGSQLKFVAGETGVNTPADPNGKRLVFPDGTPVPSTLDTRPVGADGSQGQLYPLAQLLPAGQMSWSISLVAGADTAAADPSTVQSSSALAKAGVAGDLTLADTHYGNDIALNTSPPRHDPKDPKNHAICMSNPASCQPSYSVNYESVSPAFSVVRTGTGTLNLLAGGSIAENSDYGVYTAGAQSAVILSNGQNPYNLPQGLTANGTLLGASNAALKPLAADYQANYPVGGGNVLVSAQGDLAGFISTTTSPNSGFSGGGLTDTDAVGSWLWRQGGPGQAASWWITFGALELATPGDPTLVQMDGFQGIGTLGGGNLSVTAGGNAKGLNLAVGANGRVTADGNLVQNGGGNLTVKIGGAVNFVTPLAFGTLSQDAGGVVSDLRGNTSFSAGSVGNILPVYGTAAVNDPRFVPPLSSETATVNNGIDLLPGDGVVTVNSRGDLVIDGANNPGGVRNQVNTTPVNFVSRGRHIKQAFGGSTDFSLWSQATGINLFSAGGDVTPVEAPGAASSPQNDSPTSAGQTFYPPNLSVIAQNGNIDFGSLATMELAPSLNGQLQLLAANSILGAGAVVSMSGASLATVATPFNPGFNVKNIPQSSNNFDPLNPSQLIDFGVDTPTGALHANDARPALVYAGNGDIINLQIGAFVTSTSASSPQKLLAAKPFNIVAGRDIVSSGSIAAPDAFLNLAPNDITSITTGRDIIQSSFDIAGPGNLVVQAGRNVFQADQGAINSIGPVFSIDPSNRNSGAGISVLAGVGAAGPDYADFANLYLNPASALSLTNANQIIATNDAALFNWLQSRYGYTGTPDGAYAYFQTLSSPQQDVFLRQIYFQELNASGLEFNNPNSVRYKSYLLGQNAIATLFPTANAAGQPIAYTGDITMYGGSGIHTDFGGAIQALTPGGQTIIGVEGISPPSSAGVTTQGSGDIDIYAQSNVLLGESRVLTTFGGNILIWSAAGNINAGRGSKTTIDYTPLQRVYDNYGDVFLSPTVPSSGAGIATLNPIPQVLAGNINLVAPLGTVDASEAGIRVSGNLNIAALHVLNTANISVQGTSTGVPTASAVNVGALTAASNDAGATAQAAESGVANTRQAPLPSIWIVEILGYGGGDGSQDNPPPKNKKAHVAKI